MRLGAFEDAYEVQYGQYEKSYVMKNTDKAKEKQAEKKSSLFGF